MDFLLHHVLLDFLDLDLGEPFLIFFRLSLEGIIVFEFLCLVKVRQSAIALEELLNDAKDIKQGHVLKSALQVHQVPTRDFVAPVHEGKTYIKEDEPTTHRY